MRTWANLLCQHLQRRNKSQIFQVDRAERVNRAPQVSDEATDHLLHFAQLSRFWLSQLRKLDALVEGDQRRDSGVVQLAGHAAPFLLLPCRHHPTLAT